MMSALKRLAADIGIEGSSHNLTHYELMDLVYEKFDKVLQKNSERLPEWPWKLRSRYLRRRIERETPL